MRQIATLTDEAAAKRFADYLLTLRIESQLLDGPEGVALWVCDEDQVERARRELEAYRLGPNDPRYGKATQLAKATRQRESDEEEEYRRLQREAAEGLQPPPAEVGPRPLTVALAVVCVVAALATNLDSQSPNAEALRISKSGSEGLQDVMSGQVWRLISPIFLHSGFLHLAFNAMMLLSLGGRIESARDPARYFLLVVVLAVVSNLAEYYFDLSFSGGLVWGTRANFGGMSGVVYGLFGYAWMKARYEPDLGIEMPADTVVIMLAWFVLCVADVLPIGIANVAHGSGLVLGVLIGVAPTLLRRGP